MKDYSFNYKEIIKWSIGALIIFIIAFLAFQVYETIIKHEAKKETCKVLPTGIYTNLEAKDAYHNVFFNNNFHPSIEYIGPTGHNNEYTYEYQLSYVPYIYI